MKRYKEKNHDRLNKILMSSFLAFLMVFSILAYVIGNNNAYNGASKYEYNGFEFEIDSSRNVLSTEFEGRDYIFYTYPESAIPVPKEAISDLFTANQPGPIITFDSTIGPNLQVIDSVRFELDEIFLDKGIFFSHGVYGEPTGAYVNFPILDCVNATIGRPVIKFINASNTSISYENNCLLMKGSDFGLIELRDSLLYSIIGVI